MSELDAPQEKRAGELIERLNRSSEDLQREVGMTSWHAYNERLIEPVLNEINQAIGDVLSHPEIRLPQFKNKLKVEKVVRLPADVVVRLENRIAEVEEQIRGLKKFSKN